MFSLSVGKSPLSEEAAGEGELRRTHRREGSGGFSDSAVETGADGRASGCFVAKRLVDAPYTDLLLTHYEYRPFRDSRRPRSALYNIDTL